MSNNPINNPYSIRCQIEMIRTELAAAVNQEGFTSEQTIKLSQKLDAYITMYQIYKNRSKKDYT